MTQPIAYTYEADTHCVKCAIARFGQEPGHPWPADDARDSEGNAIGAIFPWDQWHDVPSSGRYTLVCGTCHVVLDSCEHPVESPVQECEPEPDEPCDCDTCGMGPDDLHDLGLCPDCEADLTIAGTEHATDCPLVH